MVSITIVQNDDGKVDVVVDDGTGAGGEPQSFDTVDEALAMATDTLKAGEVATGAPADGAPMEEGMEGPEGEAMEPPAEGSEMSEESEADFQGMRPKKAPGWEKFMSMKR